MTAQDKRLYGGHFCAVCHAMTAFGGRLSSFLTNYDITFWLLLQSALDTRPELPLESLPCTALPFRKVDVKPLRPDVAQTLAALNLLLIGSKADDDAQDGQRWKARAVNALYGQKFEKASAFLQQQDFPLQAITGLAQAQQLAEMSEIATLEVLVAPTSNTLGEVFACIARLHQQPGTESQLRDFGQNLGGFLYLWDALVDLPDDLKADQFNALVRACSGDPGHPLLRQAFHSRLRALKAGLDGLALGPEGKLCQGLLSSLERNLREKLPSPKTSTPSVRGRLSKAGIIYKADCCEVDCCECGSCCDCNLCDCNPCNDNQHCCNLNCCDGLCCCSDTGRGNSDCCGGNSGRSNSDCCGGSSRRSQSSCFDLFCLDTSCCGESTSRTSYKDGASKRAGLFQRLEGHKQARNLPALDNGDSSRRCPRCDLRMVGLMVGSVELEECRNCGGFWLDNKEIDELAKLPSLPHNLLHRYPVQEAPAKFLPGDCSCPACGDSALVGVPYLGVPVEMCKTCHGFWVEHGVLDRVLRAKRSPRRLLSAHKQEWRCPYCEKVTDGGEDACRHCGAPRPKTGFTGKLA